MSCADARSFLDTLSEVVRTGIQVLLWAGDADYNCNWMGNLHVADAVAYANTTGFKAAGMEPYEVAGVAKGAFKTAGNLSFMRVFEAGHEVPYYRTFSWFCFLFVVSPFLATED